MEITYCDRDDICVNRQKVLSIIGIEEHYLLNLIEFRKLWLPIINSKVVKYFRFQKGCSLKYYTLSVVAVALKCFSHVSKA